MDKFKQLLTWIFSTTASAGITPLRIVVGLIFAGHGYDKWKSGMDSVAEGFAGMGIPVPYVNAILASSAELFGGIALILGLGTRLVSIPVGFTMVVAITMVHWGPFRGMEFQLTLLTANLAFLFLGAGPLSLDALIAKKLPALTS